MLASGSNDHNCKVWGTRNLEILKEIPHANSVTKVTFAEDNKLLTGCFDNVIRTFDTDFNEIVANGSEISGMYIAWHKDFIAVADENDIKVVDNNVVVHW